MNACPSGSVLVRGVRREHTPPIRCADEWGTQNDEWATCPRIDLEHNRLCIELGAYKCEDSDQRGDDFVHYHSLAFDH